MTPVAGDGLHHLVPEARAAALLPDAERLSLLRTERWWIAHDRAQAAGLLAAMIVDAGVTEFNGVATRTCCAIGPDWADDVDAFTGGLPLL